jgi:diketogulonate reductase-like aldo/keto reductase
MRTVQLPGGESVPAFGLGTWCLGENPATRAQEIAALQIGIDHGATLIDTAEMYGEGAAEQMIGEAIRGRRDQVFLVSKVYPHNAGRGAIERACEASLRRLGTDRIDLYLLHWRSSVPFAQTIEGFQALQRAGKIRHFGVSNLDLADVQEWVRVAGGEALATNQLLYNLTRRGIEWDLLPWLAQRSVPVMAYSPIEQARVLGDPKLVGFARSHGMTPAQAALAWLLRRDDVIVIPRTSSPERMRENLGALDVRLEATQLAELDRLFPPPQGRRALEML